MLNCSLHHQFYNHTHNYTDIAFKTPSRLRGLICMHALYNTCLSVLAVNPLFPCFSLPLLCSCPLSFSPSLVWFHNFFQKNTYWVIHFHRGFSHTWYPIKLSQGIQTALRRWIETGKPVFSSTFPLLICLISHRLLGRVPLGKLWDVRSNGSCVQRTRMCNLSVIFRLQNRICRHPQIFLCRSILGPASWPVLIWNLYLKNVWPPFSSWKHSSTYVIHPYPVSFLRHFLILSVNRKSPLITCQTIAEE